MENSQPSDTDETGKDNKRKRQRKSKTKQHAAAAADDEEPYKSNRQRSRRTHTGEYSKIGKIEWYQVNMIGMRNLVQVQRTNDMMSYDMVWYDMSARDKWQVMSHRSFIHQPMGECFGRESQLASFFFSHTFTFQLLDKPWSQVSSLLPPGCCLQFLSRIGFSNPTARRFFIECC